jgi:hypothetical protein
MSYDANWRVLCPCTFENIERAAKKVLSIKDISCGPPDDEGRLELHPTLTGTDKFVEIWANPFGPFATDLMVYSNTAENREAFVETAVAAQELAEAMGLILESDDDGEDEADIELGEAREGEFPDPETPPSLDAFEANHLLDSNVDEWTPRSSSRSMRAAKSCAASRWIVPGCSLASTRCSGRTAGPSPACAPS